MQGSIGAAVQDKPPRVVKDFSWTARDAYMWGGTGL
jgi:hypothetical protein